MRFHRARPLTTRPTVSVVVPCYNYGRFLPDAVASAFAGNEDVDVEVIVVDDCSSDDSLEVADALAARDPRVRVVRHPQNLGHIATYNDGLARARGDYVVLLSADDLLTPGSLARSAALLEHHPAVGLVYGYPESFSGALHQDPATVAPRTVPTTWTTWRGEEWVRRVCARGRNIIVNPEAMMRRSLLEEIGGYDPAHPHAADMKLWLQAAARADVGRVNGPVQARYREHGANMHHTQFAGVLTDLRESLRVFEVLGERVGEGAAARGPELSPPAQQRARRAMAREAMLRAGVAQADGGATPAELAAFALACWPAVESSRRWQHYERRARHRRLPLEDLVLRQGQALRWKVRWRRWRALGT